MYFQINVRAVIWIKRESNTKFYSSNETHSEKSEILFTNIQDIIITKTTHCLIKESKEILELSELLKTKHLPSIKEDYPNYLCIFTNGSKENDVRNHIKHVSKKALSKETFMFTVEVHAVNLVLKIVSESNNNKFHRRTFCLSVKNDKKQQHHSP